MKAIKHETERVLKSMSYTYEADDGTIFNDEEECLRYERELAMERVAETVARIEELDGVLPPGFQDDDYTEWLVCWFTPQNVEEALMIKETFGIKANREELAEWALRGVTVVINADTYLLWEHYSFDHTVQTATTMLRHLGYRVEHERRATYETARQEEYAKRLCEAIRRMAASPNAIAAFESYLNRHFNSWVNDRVRYPSNMVNEFELFASLDY